MLAFMDRINLSVATPSIMAHYQWNEAQMGMISASFFAGYVLFMIPGGIVCDRFQARTVLPLSVLWWSALTFLIPFCHRVGSMALCLAVLGMGQGVLFPCINKLIARRVPLTSRAKAQGFTLSGINFGVVIGFLSGSWIGSIWGWQAIFYVYAALGFVWTLFWAWIVRADLPDEADVDGSTWRGSIPWRHILFSRSVQGLSLSYFCHNYAGYLFLAWLPTYLKNVHGFSLFTVGWAAAIPSLVAMVSMNASGWLADHLVKKSVPLNFSRKIVLCSGMSAAGLSLLGMIDVSSGGMAVALLTVSSAAKAVSTPVYWSLSVDLNPRHAGFLSAVMNTAGNIAGVVAAALTGWIVAAFDSWNLAIGIGAAVTLLGAAIAAHMIKP